MIIPSLLTYILIGVWHGSGINFIIWCNACFVYNYQQYMEKSQGIKIKTFIKNIFDKLFIKLFSCFFVISISLVFFRAPTFDSALIIYKAMLSINNNYS